MGLVFRGDNLVGHAPFSPLASHLPDPVHWLIDYAIKVVFVLFFLVLLYLGRDVGRYWVDFLDFLLQVIYDHRLLYSFLLDSLQLQGSDRFSDHSCFGVDCDVLFIFDFVEMISLSEIDIMRYPDVSFLK